MYKIIALDVDDTLLGSDGKVSEVNKKAIREARQAGVKVVIATGRPCHGILEMLDEWEIDDLAIGSGGVEVYDPKKRGMLFHNPLSIDKAKVILRWAQEKGVHAQIYDEGCFIFARDSEYARMYTRDTRLRPHADPDFINNMSKPTNKVLLISTEEHIADLFIEAKKKFGKDYFITTSKAKYLEFTNKDCTKGSALKRIAEYYGCRRGEVIAVGDGRIDITMLEYAGLGVAVDNGIDECKALADYIAPHHNDDAVAHVIDKFILCSTHREEKR